MADCDYYRVETPVIDNRVISPDSTPGAQVLQIPWCAHCSSPVKMWQAVGTADGGRLLKCGGVLAKCPLRADQLASA